MRMIFQMKNCGRRDALAAQLKPDESCLLANLPIPTAEARVFLHHLVRLLRDRLAPDVDGGVQLPFLLGPVPARPTRPHPPSPAFPRPSFLLGAERRAVHPALLDRVLDELQLRRVAVADNCHRQVLQIIISN